ncbi:cytochrome c3 family protein [Curvibacter lanceolatus]
MGDGRGLGNPSPTQCHKPPRSKLGKALRAPEPTVCKGCWDRHAPA